MTKICLWEEISEFHTPLEFTRFLLWMEDQIKNGNASEIPVTQPYANTTTMNEKWFIHINSQEIWRIVWPDPPFCGVFEKI